MGVMVDGIWRQEDGFPADTAGHFTRPASPLRNWVTTDGAPGPSGRGGFAAEPGRYHLYVSLACPWAHRTLIFRALKGWEIRSACRWCIGSWATTAGPSRRARGHSPTRSTASRSSDELYVGQARLYRPRHRAGAVGQGAAQIVNNECSEIIRIFNSAFDALGAAPGDLLSRRTLRPRSTRSMRASTRPSTTASTAAASPRPSQPTTKPWRRCSRRSTSWRRGWRPALPVGRRPTEADWRLFMTLLRFDPVYVGLFKCNIRRIADYRHLSRYLKELTGGRDRGDREPFHIKHHYYKAIATLTPAASCRPARRWICEACLASAMDPGSAADHAAVRRDALRPGNGAGFGG